jgi:energy-coupling factor transporter transmembrane protein EcfT
LSGKLEYSFKKVRKNDKSTDDLFHIVIFFFAGFVLLCVIFISLIIYYDYDINLFIDKIFDGKLWRLFLFIPVYILLALVLLIQLLRRVHYLKHFLDNCSEVTAKIENYLPEAELFGNGFDFIVSFSFTYKSKDYTVYYSLPSNPRYKINLDKYSKIGDTVQILVKKDNPTKIQIKEVYKD